jgi:hypothetical protein
MIGFFSFNKVPNKLESKSNDKESISPSGERSGRADFVVVLQKS